MKIERMLYVVLYNNSYDQTGVYKIFVNEQEACQYCSEMNEAEGEFCCYYVEECEVIW